MTPIDEVNNKSIVRDAEFVKISVVKADDTIEVVTFSNSYKPETISGTVFTPLRGLVGVGSTKKTINATSYDMNIVVTGIDSTNIYVVLSDNYKLLGSKVEIYRGYYDENYVLVSSRLRFTGLITTFNIAEELDIPGLNDKHSITFSCSNIKSILETKLTGRYTNPKSWAQYAPTDKAMSRVPMLESTGFDFGKPRPANYSDFKTALASLPEKQKEVMTTFMKRFD